MTKKEKATKLMDNIYNIMDEAGAEQVAMSESTELNQEDKINQIYDYLFAAEEIEVVDEQEIEVNAEETPAVEEPAEVAMSESTEEIDASMTAVAEATGSGEPQATGLLVDEDKQEASVEETPAVEEPDYKAMLEAQQKENETMKAELEAAKANKKPELTHDPESTPAREEGAVFGTPGVKPLFRSAQDNVFAAMNF